MESLPHNTGEGLHWMGVAVRSTVQSQRGDIALLFLIVLASCAVALLTLTLEWVRETKDNRGRMQGENLAHESRGPTDEEARRFMLTQ